MPLKQPFELPGGGVHQFTPPHRYWGYYSTTEFAELATDPNATAVLNIGAVEGHGPHLPVITDSFNGPALMGRALARLPQDVLVLGLPPTMYGKSIEHTGFPGTIALSGDTLRALIMDIAQWVADAGFSKLVLLGTHGGNVGLIDDFHRDVRYRTGLRVFKLHPNDLGSPPGLISPEEAAIAMHGGDGETSRMLYLAAELVDMSQAEGHVFDPNPHIGFSQES